MRILLIINPGIPVPPVLYGGIERIVYLLAEEYRNMGHEVTLLAGPDSKCSGETVTFGVNKPIQSKLELFREITFVWSYLNKNKNNFDLIHNFGRLIYFLPVLKSGANKIMSYQRQVSKKGIKVISRLNPNNLIFTGCSNYCVSTGNIAGKWATVYNAIDFNSYELNEAVDNDAPLMFLGRLDKIKGVHTAISVAIKTNNKLIIAGNISHTPDNLAYFKNEIEPLIDGEQIKFVGALNDTEKNTYLRQSKAMVFPIEWDEPFGIVMIEAMACGTPVIGFRRGAVPEVVVNSETGFIVNNEQEMIEAIKSIDTIDRKSCREIAKTRFNINLIAENYLNLFSKTAV